MKILKVTYLFFLNLILLLNTRQNFCHICFKDHSSHHELIKNVMNFVHMEDEVQFTNIFKALIQRFHKDLNQI